MDVATSLVQAYLRLNGYLTAVEYPLIESGHHEPARVVTDIDLLAVRFGSRPADGTRRQGRRVSGPVVAHPDPVLQAPPEHTDMIVGEVKQGRAFVNPATRDPQVLAGALSRFGCCAPDEGHEVVRELLRRGRAHTSSGHAVRMVVFASGGERAPRGWHWIRLDHVVSFMDAFLRRRHDIYRGVDLQDPALAWLALLQKCGFTLQREDSK